jgi:uroporphyrinogen III methyltransferase / synthase
VTVYLVGAGPGDPGLLTVRGAELLASADVVVHDRLSAARLLDLAPVAAERIDVGKSPRGPSVPQERINGLLVERGRAGLSVVRLKGGDPFVFARGAEEAAALAAAGVPYEVVPGITSAIAAPAYAGIPVTMRYSSTSLTVVTGHEDPTKARSDVDWEAIARVGGTIVVLMGVANLPRISERLIAGGLSPETPAAAVRWGTRPDQETVRATLGTLHHEPLAAPSTIVIGDVAGQHLDWFERRPLHGRRVVVTRSAEQAGALSGRLRGLGADVVEVPTIRIEAPADGGRALAAAVSRLGDFEWVVLTSANAVDRFCRELRDARDLAGVSLAAIGPGTAAALRAANLEPDLVPDRSVAEGLLEEFPVCSEGSGRVLLPRAAVAREVLPAGLRDRGWEVEVVETYRTLPAEPDDRARGLVESADAITFTSASTVTNFVAAFGPDAAPSVVTAIGPVTSAAARESGIEVTAEGAPHTLDGLLDALLRALGAAGSTRSTLP